MTHGFKDKVSFFNPAFKVVIAFFLCLSILLQVILLSSYYLLSHYDLLPLSSDMLSRHGGWRSPGDQTTSADDEVLVSLDTEDLGVAVANIRPSVVYITGHRISSDTVASSRGPVSFYPAILTSDKMGS